MKTDGPDRFAIDRDNKKDYDRLKDRDSPFEGRDNYELFLMAMMVGYEVGKPLPLSKRLGYAQKNTFNQEDLDMIDTIAVKEEGSLDVLLDKTKVYLIAEEYANAGIELLVRDVFEGEYGDFARRLESKIVKEYENNVKNDLNEE